MSSMPATEQKLLSLIQNGLPSPAADVMVGIGDDCAVIRNSLKKNHRTLLKTDAVVEGVHFTPGTPLTQVGWKALCRPISDIAAMGGIPRYATITVAAPSEWTTAQWKELYRGLGKAASTYGISIVGGETARSPGPLFLSVSLTGSVQHSCIRLRSGGKPGDFLCVTGKLGGSFKSGRHLRFSPRLHEGQWLASQRGVTAMMDLSDGIGSDLPKLATGSGCSFRIATDSLPRHRGCSVEKAICDGEDYELLFCVTPRLWPELQRGWKKNFPKLPLSVIGSLTSHHESPTPIPSGHDHFRKR